MSRLPEAADQVMRVLHGLRTKGMADVEALAQAAGLKSEQVATVLAELGERNWVRFRDGNRVKGWMLLGEGREEAERLVAAEVEESGLRTLVQGLYESFRVLDPQLKTACTDFQVKADQTLNDHSDSEYDAQVIARLAEINRRVQPILVRLAEAFDRFGHYGPRLDYALGQVQSGDINWFTKPSLDSYHEVWFELHEDLLVTLGIDRASELTADSADA